MIADRIRMSRFGLKRVNAHRAAAVAA